MNKPLDILRTIMVVPTEFVRLLDARASQLQGPESSARAPATTQGLKSAPLPKNLEKSTGILSHPMWRVWEPSLSEMMERTAAYSHTSDDPTPRNIMADIRENPKAHLEHLVDRLRNVLQEAILRITLLEFKGTKPESLMDAPRSFLWTQALWFVLERLMDRWVKSLLEEHFNIIFDDDAKQNVQKVLAFVNRIELEDQKRLDDHLKELLPSTRLDLWLYARGMFERGWPATSLHRDPERLGSFLAERLSNWLAETLRLMDPTDNIIPEDNLNLKRELTFGGDILAYIQRRVGHEAHDLLVQAFMGMSGKRIKGYFKDLSIWVDNYSDLPKDRKELVRLFFEQR